jgi:hypothetical protein
MENSSSDRESQLRAQFDMVNQSRAQKNLPPLDWNEYFTKRTEHDHVGDTTARKEVGSTELLVTSADRQTTVDTDPNFLGRQPGETMQDWVARLNKLNKGKIDRPKK